MLHTLHRSPWLTDFAALLRLRLVWGLRRDQCGEGKIVRILRLLRVAGSREGTVKVQIRLIAGVDHIAAEIQKPAEQKQRGGQQNGQHSEQHTAQETFAAEGKNTQADAPLPGQHRRDAAPVLLLLSGEHLKPGGFKRRDDFG